MRYRTALIDGLAGAFVLALVGVSVEIGYAETSGAVLVRNCHVNSDGTETVCDTVGQFGEVQSVFALGFAASFAWSVRRKRLPVA